ncbi:MAG: tetratricopeptide repeat protein [bacterium]
MPTSDKEQIQMVKDWWKQYGTTMLVAVLAFAITNFGWRHWQQYEHHRIERASTSYMQMLMAFDQQKNDEARLYAKRLVQDSSKSTYASLAALMQAKLAVQAGDLKLAQEQLQFVINKSSNSTMRQIARIRSARIFLATKQPQETLDLLVTVNDEAYKAEIGEVSGDALLALGRLAEAKQAYQKAKDMIAKDAKSPLLQLKMQQF